MADFNVKVGSSGDSSGFRGASQGVRAPEAQQFSQDNSKALKTQGLANDVAMGTSLFQTGVKFADDAIKQNIDTQAHEKMDQVYDEFGVSDVAIQGRDVSQEPLPSEIGIAEKSLNRLAQARERGVVNENSYWARVESLSRQLRAKYPGHRDYIDQRVSSIAGGDPANNIVRNLQEAADKQAAKASSTENKKLSLVEDLAKKGVLLHNWENMSFAELVNNHAPLLRDIAKTEQDKAQLELAKSRNEATDILASKSVDGYVNRQLDMATSNLINPNNETFSKMIGLIEKGTKSGSLSPDEENNLRTSMNSYRMKVTEEIMSGIRMNFGDSINSKMLENAKQTIDSHMAIYENALANKDYGLLSLTLHSLEDQKTNDQVILSKSPIIRLNAALNTMLGPQSSEMIMQWSNRLAEGRDKALFANELAEQLAGNGEGRSVYNSAISSKDKVKDIGKFTESMVDAHTSIINNPSSKPEAIKSAAKALYGADNAPFLQEIKGAYNKERAYNRLVNQTTFNKMKQIRDSGDADTYNNYVGWSKNAFPVLFRSAADTLSKTTSEQGLDVQFSPETSQFVLKSPSPNDPSLNGKNRALYGQSFDTVQRAVNRMNSAIRGLVPILKEEGQDPTVFLSTAFQNLGMDTKGNVLGLLQQNLVKGAAMKLGGSTELTAADLAIQLPQGKELQMKDPNTGTSVSRFRPGDSATIVLPTATTPLGEAPVKNTQMTAQQGDAMQLEELNNMATNKKQDLVLLQQLTKENPEDQGLRDKLNKLVEEYTSIVSEIHTINNSWVEQFKRTTP